jgi:hypothetical protein
MAGSPRIILAIAILAIVPILPGQTTAPPDPVEQGSFWSRFSIGGRGSVLFNNLMNNDTHSTSTSDPPLKTTLTTVSTSSRPGAGATIEFAILDNLAVSVDVLYRKAGYKGGVDIVEGVDDPATNDKDERMFTTTYEGTRARYWDVPVVARLYDGSRHEMRPRAFLAVGAAIRRTSNIRSFREYLYPDNTTEVDETPITPANTAIVGAVIGGGFQFRSSAGLKVTPEVRLTRWLGNTFDSSPTQSNRNQLEFLIGFTF